MCVCVSLSLSLAGYGGTLPLDAPVTRQYPTVPDHIFQTPCHCVFKDTRNTCAERGSREEEAAKRQQRREKRQQRSASRKVAAETRQQRRGSREEAVEKRQ